MKNEEEEWDEIILRLNKILDRNVRHEMVSTTFLEFIKSYEQKEKQINHLHKQMNELRSEISTLNSMKREGN